MPASSSPAASVHGSVGLLFPVTVFASAFLLFQVQPMVSKFILPWFGGSPAVWTTAMLFFQSVLFGGYVYAHLLGTRASRRRQVAIHLTLLVAAAAAAAFVLPGEALKPLGDEAPVGRILLILGLSVGLPYFCLATTGPLVQHWYAQAGMGGSVFRLYALSNVGSFIALLCGAIVLGSARHRRPSAGAAASPAAAAQTPPSAGPSRMQRARWVLLPALASLAFIATTDHVSHDIAPEPRLWIATLGLYLLTFILSFDHPRWYRPAWTAAACLVAVVFLSGRSDIPGWFGADWDYGMTEVRGLHYAAMFLACFLCHGELYRQRPADTRHLTAFYLWMSFGGACGGLFVAMVATNLFDDYYEWPLFLVAAIALSCAVLAREWRARPGYGTAGAGAGAGALASLVCIGLVALILWWEDPLHRRALSGGDWVDVRLDQSRNFYGTVSVKERRHPADPSRDYRVFYSGQITHGIQYLDPAKRRLPVTYYSEESGIGETLLHAAARSPSLRVALVGLGAGTLATYAREDDHCDFFEINPEAVRVADVWFDNVSACRSRTKRMIVGDARLKMAQLPDDLRYDVIVLDAFTGGSVPTHLLTVEAFAIYRRHLKPGGYIAINITNGYLNLYPIVRAQAEALGMGFRNKFLPADPARHIRRNQHFVMTEDTDYLQRHPSVNRRFLDANGRLLRTENLDVPGVPLWTDRFSSLNRIAWPD
jgi:hypothetical protein